MADRDPSEFARKGAEAANSKRTPEQRVKLAKKAAKVRWGNKSRGRVEKKGESAGKTVE